MRTTTGPSHANNVRNFTLLRDRCRAMGASYNPPRPEMHIDAMNSILTRAQAAMAPVYASQFALAIAMKTRATTLAPLLKLVTRSLQALKSSSSDSALIDHAAGLVRQFRGTRKNAMATESAHLTSHSVPPSQPSIGHDMVVETLQQYAALLLLNPSYTPAESDLSGVNFAAWRDIYIEQNRKVQVFQAVHDQARTFRDHVMHDVQTGLVPIALAVKAYIFSTFGGSSLEYKSIANLRFTSKH